MHARDTRHALPHWLWPVLIAVAVAAMVLLMARPAARVAPDAMPASAAVSHLLASPTFIRAAARDTDANTILQFFTGREFQPVWTTGRPAQHVRDALLRAAEEGLDPTDYRVLRVTPPDPHAPAEEIATYEILLTDSFFRYARDLSLGRARARAVYRDMQLPAQSFDPAASLQTALANGTLSALLDGLAPPHPEYGRLRTAMKKYRQIAGLGGWQSLPPGIALDLRSDDPRRTLLEQRLAAEGDLNSDGEADLSAAVIRFQRRNGLEADGRLGPKTLSMLNVTAEQRVAQIVANMERWRWLPRALESRRIMVNAADASLELIDETRTRLSSKVIVGAPHTPTPLFRTVATAITVNPPWNVPHSIAVNEILPKLRRDPAYLQKNDMVLLGAAGVPQADIDWKNVSARAFPYSIRQRPGPKNPLGVVKLEMANSFNVYLHDTPGKASFARIDRTLSHGCIRVEQIMPLASLALTGDARAAVETLTGAIAIGETRRLALPEPIPVYVLYWTAMADPDGTVHFRQDVYGRDRRLIASLRPPVPNTPVAFYSGDCETLAG